MDKKDLISSHRSNVYDNFLMHWKYIKREKVGDKWKYTYKDDAVTDARTKLGKSVIDYKKAVATENKLKADKPKVNEALTTESLNKSDAKVNAQLATSTAKRAVEKARKEYESTKAKSDASIGNRIAKALNGEKSTKETKDKGVVEKQLSNGVTYTVPYDEKLDGPKETTTPKKTLVDMPKKKSLSDKAKSVVNTAKDKLGVDEHEAYKDAKAAYENATDKKNEADKEAEKARRRFLDDPKSDYKADDAILKVNMLRFWREKERKRGEEYINAKTEYMDTPLGTALKISEAVKDIPFEVENAIDKIGNKIVSIGKKDSSKETLSDVNGKNIPQKVIEQEVITDKDIPSKKNEIVKTFNNSSKTFDDNTETWDDVTGVIPKASKNKSADVTRNAAGWIDAKRELTDEEIKAETEQAKEMFDSYFKYHHKLEDCQPSIFCETSADIDPKTKVETGTYTSTIYLKKNDGQHLTVSQITKTDKNTSDVKKIRDAISDYYMETKFGENWDSDHLPLKKK